MLKNNHFLRPFLAAGPCLLKDEQHQEKGNQEWSFMSHGITCYWPVL